MEFVTNQARKKKMWLLGTGCLAFIAALSVISNSEEKEEPVTSRGFYMGFTPFPWDFSVEAVDETYAFLKDHADIIAHHIDGGVPWPEALEEKPYHSNLEDDWKKRAEQSAGKKVYLALTPLNGDRKGMAQYRGEKENLPLPEEFQGKSLDDPMIMKAYRNYCLRAVKLFHPDYLAIGIEVNELIHHNAESWPAFVNLYKHVYSEIKKEYASLPIFATVTLHNMRNTGWGDLETQQAKIKEFLPLNDIAGISYYPFMIGNIDHPKRDLEWLAEFIDKPIAICETGFPAETIRLASYNLTIPADPERQSNFYKTLLQTAQDEKYLFVVSFLYRDYDALWDKIKGFSPEAFIVWKDCGLLNEKGEERSAYQVWERYRVAKKD